MAEVKPRVQKVLAELYGAEGILKPKEIADKIGETALNVGRDLHDLKGRSLAVAEEEGQWKITDEGRAWIESGESKENRKKDEPKGEPKGEPKDEDETVPSQSDLFKSIGERFGVGGRKGDVRLDTIVYYVQRTANLDDLSSVWNALTEMGVANDVKKRWIKIYAQNLPGSEIPEELKARLDSGESEKVKTETGEVPPKPKRFTVVSGEIIGDPEGDYNFKEALQYVAQQRGAPPDEAGSMALELSKMGPDMLATILGAVTPLLQKDSPPDSTLSQTLQILREAGIFGKQEGGDILDRMSQLGLLKKPGEEGESSQTIVALQGTIKELSDSMRKQEMDTVKNAVVSLSNQLSEMRKDMANQSKVEGRYTLMEKTITTLDNQLSGIRTDAKPLLMSIADRGSGAPAKKSPEEKARLTRGLKEAVVLEKEAKALEDELLFGGKPQS